jgi:hypothetical protein
VRLTGRDEAILEHVHRYRISTIEVLHRLFWEPGTTLNAVSQVLGRLDAHLQTAPLVGPRRYYLLTPEAAREFGEEEEFARPLGATSLARHYAMLELCCLSDERREHITPRELREGFPRFNLRGVARHGYFHTHGEPPRLGWLEVDCGGHAARRARKCLEQFRKRHQHEAFRELADRGQFGIALVTTSPAKREAIERALEKLDPFPIEIHVLPAVRDIIIRDGES